MCYTKPKTANLVSRMSGIVRNSLSVGVFKNVLATKEVDKPIPIYGSNQVILFVDLRLMI